ncbi:uncharacterized protein [Nicotiana tomentosiformis]|uniref:uncharacterized protein n=1 Tax=Nicotiana tomentosiformis TaxID=4098 RepID=UPI00388C379C
MSFPEEWNIKSFPWFPGAVPDLAGLGDSIVMRPPPLREVQMLRDEDEEGEDTDCILVAQKRESIEASKAAELVTVEGVQSEKGLSRILESSSVDDASCRDEQLAGGDPRCGDAIALHREASSKYRAELARCEADLKKLTEERNTLKLLYVQQKAELVEELREEAKMKEAETLGWKQIMDRLDLEKDVVRAQLSSVERQLQAQKVKELETRLAAELARATSEAEVLVASYRADAEAANTQAKEIFYAVEVRLSRVADHARRQSRSETLKEVHARGFDLMADIKSAKVLEDEVGALFSDDKDSASGSDSEGDEDEAPEDAAPEAD